MSTIVFGIVTLVVTFLGYAIGYGVGSLIANAQFKSRIAKLEARTGKRVRVMDAGDVVSVKGIGCGCGTLIVSLVVSLLAMNAIGTTMVLILVGGMNFVIALLIALNDNSYSMIGGI